MNEQVDETTIAADIGRVADMVRQEYVLRQRDDGAFLDKGVEGAQ